MPRGIADDSHNPAPIWTQEQTQRFRRAREVTQAKQRDAAQAKEREAAQAKQREGAQAKQRKATRAREREDAQAKQREAHERETAAAANLQIPAAPDGLPGPGFLSILSRTGRRFPCKVMFGILMLVVLVASCMALGEWLWALAGMIPGVQSALKLLFATLMMPFRFLTAPTKDSAVVDVRQTDIVLSPYMLDMNRGITYLSFVSSDGDTSRLVTLVVDEALWRNGLLDTAEITETSKVSSIYKVLFNVSKTARDMDSQGHRIQEQVEETLTNDYREAQNLLQAIADAKGPRSEATVLGWVKVMGASSGLPWERMLCWFTGKTPTHQRFEEHMGRFQRMLDDAVGAQQLIADAFNNNTGGSVLSEGAGSVQLQLCKLDDALAQAVGVGSHGLAQKKKAIAQGSQGQGEEGENCGEHCGEQEKASTADIGSQGRGELAHADIAVIEVAVRELRGTHAIGATLCHQARQTTAGLTAQRDAVLDLQRDLGRMQVRVAKRRAVVEEAGRHKCLEEDVVAKEEEELERMVKAFVKMLETAYVA